MSISRTVSRRLTQLDNVSNSAHDHETDAYCLRDFDELTLVSYICTCQQSFGACKESWGGVTLGASVACQYVANMPEGLEKRTCS